MVNKKLLSIIETLNDELIGVYRKLHQYPELPNEEFETTKMIKQLLAEVGIEVLNLPLKTGLVAEVKGNPNGPVVAIRCDIDALPILEETNLSYKSKIDGKMHACGHDFHTAAILGAAYLVKKYQPSLIGTVRFIFQPAEEIGEGAKKIIDTGVLDDVDVIFGLHNVPDAEVGIMGIKSGPVTAAVDRFEIKITGVGSHAARPEKGVDPIIIASNIVTSLQTIVSRNVSPAENALLSVTHIQGGNTWNVIPESAYLQGTVRTLDEKVRELIPKRMNEIINGIAQSYGGSAELIWHSGSPATNNTEEWAEYSANLGKKVGYTVKSISMGLEGEDFAYYQKKIPGAFIIIGTGLSHAHHHPEYKVDENAILQCAKYFAQLAEGALKELVDKNYR
ncbi:amidohydrolase [Clostridium saccharobutylicum]|uniref:Hydrolase YxeP n=1 Tax=Clostridium saccharobutylicum DSM 13864 TaxID=1345695 RepID=U5N0C4_CLOSA|nr:amidohydrolase [Clostridium saccharobutylicum]AGX45242.1 hydrolase YxeP [Clostridium saccharobutylicum DSM 13864]AQR92519.1 putative hydrolase YxeP [Clostridium saccharobutylicum]AQS02422.1 putative hydrolase YxeP [Clostridium saccharobutylicum]AQS16405.1 putative hydrolase YxeP [Clostridium saccharobutylicum]MBA2906808.1 amidohydrolase [Clostridium saccharobutylicum]